MLHSFSAKNHFVYTQIICIQFIPIKYHYASSLSIILMTFLPFFLVILFLFVYNKVISIQRGDPVSYTHRDVYKRQKQVLTKNSKSTSTFQSKSTPAAARRDGLPSTNVSPPSSVPAGQIYLQNDGSGNPFRKAKYSGISITNKARIQRCV